MRVQVGILRVDLVGLCLRYMGPRFEEWVVKTSMSNRLEGLNSFPPSETLTECRRRTEGSED